MYGWRGKIGLILPSLNNTMEPEFNKMVPEGVAVFATRILLEKGLPEELEKMAEDTERATDLLRSADVTGILYGCTSGSLIKGVGWDREIIERIEDRAGVPATTTSTSVIEAFETLGIKSVSVVTPYVDAVNRIEKEFFENHGVKVLNIEGLQYTKGAELHKETPETAYAFAKRVCRQDADCIFISCTDFAAVEILNALERDTGKPAMTSNTASLWGILKKMGIKEKMDGYGEILRHL